MTTDKAFLNDAYIQEGMSPAEGVVVVCATVGDDDDNPETRIGVRRDGAWLKFSLDGDAGLSVDSNASGEAYVLGESGAVVAFNWMAENKSDLKKSLLLIENPEAEDDGPLRRIRILGDDVICAGSVGQAYLVRNKKLVSLPKLIVNGEAPTIEDLAGSSASNFIAVTSDGYVAHFDGKKWSVIDFPSNASFTSICMMGNGSYAICGKMGVVVIGSLASWHVVPGLDDAVDYWGIASQEDRLYAAHLEGVDEIMQTGSTPVAIPNADRLDFTVLRSCSDGVWAFSGRTIGMINNGVWTTLTS